MSNRPAPLPARVESACAVIDAFLRGTDLLSPSADRRIAGRAVHTAEFILRNTLDDGTLDEVRAASRAYLAALDHAEATRRVASEAGFIRRQLARAMLEKLGWRPAD